MCTLKRVYFKKNMCCELPSTISNTSINMYQPFNHDIAHDNRKKKKTNNVALLRGYIKAKM